MQVPDVPHRRLPGRQQEARSNDSAVLAAAREVFSTRGSDASMAEVAQRAGVGVGSVYRRYPTKEALIEALRVSAVSEAAALAHEVAADADAQTDAGSDAGADSDTIAESGGAVATFLRRQILGAAGPNLQPTGGGAGKSSAALAAASDYLHEGLERLVARDLAHGLVPAGFTAADVMQLLLHLRPVLPIPRSRADELHLRYLGFVMRGLVEQARAGIPVDDGPDWAEWLGAWHD
ncbi:helix-turn-helix domain-containing protein [Agromyces seonyuensis]|uniref:TetR family transcriptional regulator n=1 Tax=Agromyces seonyuensis TaxID=2662446 RepID=A0A6I4NVI1_9MICO|nr:helix-turn-helix domain-containing protein [Agromyces seonyuensis]MWB97102.1 TetR family transcriptional regulator [Agromyces seonyuensis]